MGGTLSSYCWANLVLHFLQTRPVPILPSLQADYEGERAIVEGVDISFNRDVQALHNFGQANKETLGQLLFRFFKHYALEFDYARDVVSVRTGKTLTKTQKGWDVIDGRIVNFFCVEEPFVNSRNLGNSADKISVDGLRQEFMRGLLILARKGDLDSLCEPYVKPMGILPPPPEVYFDYDGSESQVSIVEPNLDVPRKHHNRSTSAPGNKHFDANQWAAYGNFNRLNARFSENMNHNLAYGQIYAGYQAPAGMASYVQYWEQQRLLAQSKSKEYQTELPLPYFPGYAYPMYMDPLTQQMQALEVESDDEPKRNDENTSQSGTVLMSHDDSSSNRGASSTPSPGMRPKERLEDDGHSVSSGTARDEMKEEDKPSWSSVASKLDKSVNVSKGLVWSNRPNPVKTPGESRGLSKQSSKDSLVKDGSDDSRKRKKSKNKGKRNSPNPSGNSISAPPTPNIRRKESPQTPPNGRNMKRDDAVSQAVAAMANVIKDEVKPESTWASLVARGTR
jgi:hypothetical protein